VVEWVSGCPLCSGRDYHSFGPTEIQPDTAPWCYRRLPSSLRVAQEEMIDERARQLANQCVGKIWSEVGRGYPC